MAFSDPQSITINAIANSLARTSFGVNQGKFSKDDGTVQLTASHAYNARTRRLLRVDHKKIAPDVFSGDNQEYTMGTWLVVEHPVVGYTNVELKQVIDGFVAYLSASSGANVTRLLGGEV